MDCLICLEPINGAPFQSAKRLTCECKVSTHEHCYREYRAAKGHTECLICHNRNYERIRRRSSVSEVEDDALVLDARDEYLNSLVRRVLARNASNDIDAQISALIERVLASPPPPPPPTPWTDTFWNICFFVAAAAASYSQYTAEIQR